MPRQCLGVEFNVIRQFHLDDVVDALVGARWATVLHINDIPAGLDHAFAAQKADGEFEVVSGRAHGHRDAYGQCYSN